MYKIVKGLLSVPSTPFLGILVTIIPGAIIFLVCFGVVMFFVKKIRGI